MPSAAYKFAQPSSASSASRSMVQGTNGCLICRLGNAEAIVCQTCADKFEAGAQEVRVHDDLSDPAYTFRFPKGN